MPKLIQDIVDSREAEQRQHERTMQARRLDTLTLVRELHRRGVTIREVYGRYYEIEAVGEAQSERLFGNDEEGLHGSGLTVEDAELAGVSETIIEVRQRQPF